MRLTKEHHEDGAVLVLFAVLFMPIVMLTGMAIDITRANYINTEMSYACDAAALAAARYDIANYQENGLKVFNANFKINSNDVTVNPTIMLNNDNTLVSCKADGTLKSSISGISHIISLSTEAKSVVERTMAPTEIAVVLNTKGTATGQIRGIVNKFIGKLSKNKSGNNLLALSIVPYGGVINIGTQHASWLTNPSDATNTALFPSKDPWMGCVGSAFTGLTMPYDDPPSIKKWPIYRADSTYNVFGAGVKGDNDYTQTATKVTVKTSISQVNVSPNRSCGLAIYPLNKAGTNLTSYINGLQPTYGGGTLADMGLLWGWNTLSPRWAGFWDGDTAPQPYGITVKSIVLFTDGYSDWPSLAGHQPLTGEPNAYGMSTLRSAEGKLGATSTSFTGICTNANARSCINARITHLCNKIKEKKIQIFVVNYGVTTADTVSVYSACATNPEWAFFPKDAKTLEDNFDTIANNLLSIQVVK